MAQLGTRLPPSAFAVLAHPRQERRARRLRGQTIRLGLAGSQLVQATQHNCPSGQPFFAQSTLRVLCAVLVEQRQRQRELAVMQRPLRPREQLQLAGQRSARSR